jgi:F-type H+-transporting ATPase subunit b
MEALGINWGLLLAQLFNVGITIWLLSVLLYRPILNMLNNRTKRIEDSLRDAEEVKQQLARAEQSYEETLARARGEAQQLLAQAQERAKAQEAEIVAQARNEAERIKEEARQQLAQERAAMVRDLQGQMGQLVTLAAGRVLGREVKGNYDQLINESIAELGRQN